MNGTWRDKVAAGFTNSGAKSGDKLHTLTSLAVFAAQHHMHWVSLGLGAGLDNTSTGSRRTTSTGLASSSAQARRPTSTRHRQVCTLPMSPPATNSADGSRW